MMLTVMFKSVVLRLLDERRDGPVLRFRTTPAANDKIKRAAALTTGGNESLLILAAAETVADEILRQNAQEEKRNAA